MEVADRGDDPLEDGPGLPLGEELLPHDLVQQLAAAHQLEHEAHLFVGEISCNYDRQEVANWDLIHRWG